MKTNTKKTVEVMAALLLMTGCSSVQKQLPQMAKTVPVAATTVLQGDTLPEWTPDASRADRLAEQPNSECTKVVLPVQGTAKDEKKDADTPPDEITADPIQDVPVQPNFAQGEMPSAQEQLEESIPQTKMSSIAEEQPTPTEQPQPEPTPQPAPTETLALEETPTPALAYGAIPFSLANGTGKWWHIDAIDSAYWVVAEQINAMRAAGGLEPLSMDESLSTTASSRCESFVAGGPFDHSGMVTRSEICASGGPLGSAAAVCAEWQVSDAHYANIMNPSFTRMGVSCWFCADGTMQMTYWTVTFE